MRPFDRAPRFGHTAAALMLVVSVAAAAVVPQPACAQSDIANLVRLHAIYIADPATPWFEKWAETNLKTKDWLHRPDIKIKAGSDLVAAVAGDPAGIGLLTRGELTRVQAASGPSVVSAPTGVSICAALSVNSARTEQNFGDFALSGDTIEMLASPDTLAIAEALIDAHRFKDRIALRQVSAGFGELASEKPALAMLPVLPGARLPENAASRRPVGIGVAAIAALQLRGFSSLDYRTSFFQRWPLIEGVRTACDEIVLITSIDTALAQPVFGALSTSWTNPFTGSDLVRRVLQAWDALQSLWGKSLVDRG